MTGPLPKPWHLLKKRWLTTMSVGRCSKPKELGLEGNPVHMIQKGY